jgi:alcohol dehydrogenase class IV
VPDPPDFTWRDGERLIRFGRGALADARELLGEGFLLLTTPRAAAQAPEVASLAGETRVVGPGRVDELAGDLLDVGLPDADLVVALGGGRVIDTAKAVAAALGRSAAAVPTTLSAAEMTAVHRTARGAEARGRLRPRVVLTDPALSASQPERPLAASAANALAHALEALVSTGASPVPSLAAREAVRLTEEAARGAAPTAEREGGRLGADGERAAAGGERLGADGARDALALAALLSGYALDSAGYGLHHVLSQTVVRIGGAEHGPVNAALLPHATAALRERSGAALPPGAEALARTLAETAGVPRLRDAGVPEDALDACAEAAAKRDDLDRTPPRATAAELRALLAAAY